MREQYDIGADPAVVLADLAEFTHFVTRVKVVPAVADDVSLSEAERMRGRAFAAQLSMRVLSRTWQMLLKGIAEVQAAGRPLAAAEMVLVRIAYAADLPTPDEVVRSLSDDGGAARRAAGQWRRAAHGRRVYAPRYEAPRGSPRSSRRGFAASGATIRSPARRARGGAGAGASATFEELVALPRRGATSPMKMALERDVRLVRCEDGQLEIALEPSARQDAGARPVAQAAGWTGKRWMVVVSHGAGRADVARAGRGAAGRDRARRAEPIRWCRRC